MRLSFPSGEHADILIAQGEATIGALADNKVALQADGIQPHHASVTVHPRVIVLQVAGPDARAFVNARPIHEKAILRLGDVLNLDSVRVLIKPDRDDNITTPAPPPPEPEPESESKDPMSATAEDNQTRYRNIPPKAVLRGVSGPYFGKLIPVRGRLVIGRGNDCDLVLDEPEMSRRHAMIETSNDGVYLRDLGSQNGTFVNGVQVKDAVLQSGDQLAFDRNRFLIEAPGLPGRADRPAGGAPAAQITQTMQAIKLEAPAIQADVAKPNNSSLGMWILIGAGALVAALIGLLFFRGAF